MLFLRTRSVVGKLSAVLSLSSILVVSGFAEGEIPGKSSSHWDYFALDNGVGRNLGWTPEQQAKLLSELGYDGISYTGVKSLDARLRAMEGKKLNVFGLYLPCHPNEEEPFAKDIVTALPRLEGEKAVLWIQIKGKTTDEKTVEAIATLADAAAEASVRVVIYPHFGDYVATAEHALKIVHLADRPNVGLSFNLCHELRSGNLTRIDDILDKVADDLMMVTIHGANKVDKPRPKESWARYIRPLDEGDFDLKRLLKKLKDVGYRGPIGQQCWSIKLPPEENLKRSIAVWRQINQELR